MNQTIGTQTAAVAKQADERCAMIKRETLMVNPWDKILADDFEAGFRLADKMYSISSQRFDLRARAISSFLLRNYEAALVDFFELKGAEQSSDMVSDGTYLDIGLCYYAKGNNEKAIEYLKYPVVNRKLIKYTGDISIPPSVLLYFGLRLQKQDIQKLATKELRRSKQPIPQYLLGLTSEEDLNQLHYQQAHENLRNRKECKTEFYKAVKALQNEDIDLYYEHLKQCVELKGNYLEFEYFIARVELDELNSR